MRVSKIPNKKSHLLCPSKKGCDTSKMIWSLNGPTRQIRQHNTGSVSHHERLAYLRRGLAHLSYEKKYKLLI